MSATWKSSFAILIVLASLLLPVPQLHAGTTLLIWPIDPTIEAGERGTALWIENVGSDPLTVQIRLLAWGQRDYRDDYAAQQQLVTTPPFSSIAPGKKQLVRLTLLQPVPAGQERAFRILIDEIPPARDTAPAAAAAGAGLKFQMRYSLPLFVYGDGLWRKGAARVTNAPARQAQPQLLWSLAELDGRHYLQVQNTGSGHARLSQVRLHPAPGATNPASTPIELAAGLLGYVLPGSTMRWPVNTQIAADDYVLQAQLSGVSPTTIARE